MAATPQFLDGTEVLLLIDTVTPISRDIDDFHLSDLANFEPIGCLSSNAWEVSTASVDTSTKCTGKDATSIPGQRSGTASAEGRAISNAEAASFGFVNHNSLYSLWANSTTFWLAMYDPAYNTFRLSLAYITSHSDTAPNADSQTFSTSFQLVGQSRELVPTT